MKIVKTANYIVYVNNGKVTLAKSLKTGKFIKLSLAQAEYDAKYTNNEALYCGISLAMSYFSCILFFAYQML